MHHLVKLLRYKKTIVVVYFLLVLAALWQVVQLNFEHERRRFFPGNDSDLEFTENFFQEIEQDDIFIFSGVELPGSVLDHTSWQLVDSVTKAIDQLACVKATVSISNLPRLKKTGPSLYAVPLVQAKPGTRKTDSLRLLQHPYVLKNLLSDDFTAVNIIAKTHVTKQEEADTAYTNIRSVLESFHLKGWHMSGYPVVQSVSVGQLQWEMAFYTGLSGLILVVVLLLVYRSLPGFVIPILGLAGGMIMFFAFLRITGQTLDLMSSLFPILMLIFLMADVIHLQTHYIDMLEEGHEQFEALTIAIKEIGVALLLTSFTTAVGFGTLTTSSIAAVRDFGLNAAVGVMIAFVTVMVFATSGLLFFKKGQIRGNAGSNELWRKLMQRIYVINKQRSKVIIISTIGLLFFAVWGISLISTNTFMKDEFPDDDKMKQDFEYFEQKFGGVRSFEMAILPSEGLKADDPEVLMATAKLESYLKEEHDMHNLLSPVSPYRLVHQAYTKEKADYSIPDNAKTLRRYRAIIASDTSSAIKSLMNDDKTMGRISARLNDLGSDIHAQRNTEIRQWISENIDTDKVSYRVTGTTLMYDKNHAYLRYSLLMTMGLAFLIVGILFAILFRDYRMVIVSLIPNILPLALAAAAMGFLGITLYSLTAIFFAISFGIAVDDTIHFLTRYKLERRKGLTVDKSIKNTMHISGKAIILTSLVLIFSFLALTTSNFKGTYYIGVLVSITLVAAVLADLFLLPQLIYFINRRSIKKGKHKTL